MEPQIAAHLQARAEDIARFCKRWHIKELALFGSVLRDDFNPSSDIDLLATFDSEADWGLLDLVRMEQELEEMLGRKVDLLTRRAVERSHNSLRRGEILSTAQVVYGS